MTWGEVALLHRRQGSYGNIPVQDAYPDRGCVVLHRLTLCGRHQSDDVLRTATFQCWLSNAALVCTTVDVLHPGR